MLGTNKHDWKYLLLQEDDMIQQGDEYYNPMLDKWLPVEEWDTEWRVDEHKPIRRKNPVYIGAVFTPDQIRRNRSEGWDLFLVDNKYFQIQRIDEKEMFDSDAAALIDVQTKAKSDDSDARRYHVALYWHNKSI